MVHTRFLVNTYVPANLKHLNVHVCLVKLIKVQVDSELPLGVVTLKFATCLDFITRFPRQISAPVFCFETPLARNVCS